MLVHNVPWKEKPDTLFAKEGQNPAVQKRIVGPDTITSTNCVRVAFLGQRAVDGEISLSLLWSVSLLVAFVVIVSVAVVTSE